MTSIYENKNSAELRLIHAEQMPLYIFYHFKVKRMDRNED